MNMDQEVIAMKRCNVNRNQVTPVNIFGDPSTELLAYLERCMEKNLGILVTLYYPFIVIAA